MPLDPFLGYNPFNDLTQPPPAIPAPGTQPPGAGPRIPPFTPAEEESILSRLGTTALHGLGWLGSSLGKALGGRAIRGALGGHADELASIIPFSDTLGITDPSREVRGSDLLGGDKDTPLLSPEGIGGVGLDILLDPASYLTFGGSALNAAGRAARRAGTLPGTVAERVAQGLGGHVGLGLPFAAPSTTVDLSRQLGAVSGAAGALWDKVPNAIANPLERAAGAVGGAYRGLKSLFRPELMNATSAAGQEVAPGVYSAINRERARLAEKQLEAANTLREAGSLTPEGLAELRSYAELSPKQAYIPKYGGVEQAYSLLKPELEAGLQRGQQLGLTNAQPLVDEFVGHFPRYEAPLAKETAGFGGRRKMLPTDAAALGAREEILKNIPGGATAINEMVGNPQLRQMSQLTGADFIRKNALEGERMFPTAAGAGMSAEDTLRYALANKAQSGTATVDELTQLRQLEGRYNQSLSLADWVSKQDPQLTKAGAQSFYGDPLSDFLQGAVSRVRVNEGAEGIQSLLANTAKKVGTGPMRPGDMPLMDVLRRVPGFAEAGDVTSGVKTQMIQRLGLTNPADLFNMVVPAAVANDATKFVKAFTTPEGIEPFLKIVDSVTNLTKAGQTGLWPAFHARNAVTGMWQNWVTNAFDPRYGAGNPMRYVQPIKDAWAARTTGVFQGAADLPIFRGAAITDEQATRKIMEMAYANRLTRNENAFSEIVGGQVAPGQFRMPGDPTGGLLEEAQHALQGSNWNPLNIAGVGGTAGIGKSNVTTFKPAVLGNVAGEAVDETNRLSAFIAKLRQGYTPEMASAESKLAHFDYSALTDFERTYARRVIPFYNWMSNNIPFAIRQIAEHPGGKLATGIKVAGEARGQQGGFLPDYLQDTLAVPLGGRDEEGNQRFLNRSGLPFEDLPGYLSGSQTLSMLNPMFLKYPIETLTGRQLESGRRLSDMYSMTGQPALDELLANSPVSRAVSTLRTGVDERKTLLDKAVNMLSGVHLSDIDMEKAKSIAVRDYLEQAMQGPHFRQNVNVNARPEELANLTPYEINLLRLQATRNAEARRRVVAQRPQ